MVELGLHERKGETPQCFQEPLSIVLPTACLLPKGQVLQKRPYSATGKREMSGVLDLTCFSRIG